MPRLCRLFHGEGRGRFEEELLRPCSSFPPRRHEARGCSEGARIRQIETAQRKRFAATEGHSCSLAVRSGSRQYSARDHGFKHSAKESILEEWLLVAKTVYRFHT